MQTCLHAPWALTYANADRSVDMRDEETALRDARGHRLHRNTKNLTKFANNLRR
ncbi:hypothetical protein ACNKHS_05390 [Shigella flexneri]